ncbi:kinesin-like protein KIF12 isoform X2 [Atheta coriaria]|uniref:kinesin-like protein KIF12 isoform X2 n=1 Tax=Dalotia coriaria TaxID=877792 RepID=UPI0031F38195
MMVTRPTRLYKTPPGSRGNSPNRTTAVTPPGAKKKASTPPAVRRPPPGRSPARSPQKTPPTKARSVGNSPVRNTTSNRSSRGSSPAKTPQSRGSDTGSIDVFDETDTTRRVISTFNQGEDNINVVVRVRPLNPKEQQRGDRPVLQFPGNGQILCEAVDDGGPRGEKKPKLFSYNVVFEPAATQEDVLQFSGIKRLIEMAMEGFRCTAFCYGQTGSGKTHTLTGPPGLFGKKFAPYSDQHGLVFRSFLYLFQLIKAKPEMHFVLKASFLEIYNEKVIDLLNPGSVRKPLAVRWSKKARGFFVENLFTVDCEELDDLIAVLEEGMRNRSVGSHNMNDTSSRSHTILSVYITSEQPAENGVFISRSGKLNFVDLAGSEMTKKTQSEGKTLEEANNINKSLMVLGYCIASLSDPKRKDKHIPYRDSKLTKLLADSLAGNGVTLMIACISPAKYNYAESINTLRYAARAKKIRTKPVVLMDPREALILSLKREVNALQTENEHLRSALNGYKSSSFSETSVTGRPILSPEDVNPDRLAQLEGPQLVELIRVYVQENEALHKDNEELFASRDALLREHEIVSRENERLLKKLEDVNSSPLIQTGAISAEIGSHQRTGASNVWTNPIDHKETNGIPESIQKELDKRRIGDSIPEKMSAHRRHNSWDGRPGSNTAIRAKSSGSDGGKSSDHRARMQHIDVSGAVGEWRQPEDDKPRFSMGNKDMFGSSISIDQDDDDIFDRP